MVRADLAQAHCCIDICCRMGDSSPSSATVKECLVAFKTGDKSSAVQKLALVSAGPSDEMIKTTFQRVKSVSLLHLAAHHGWLDIAADLVAKLSYTGDCKDGNGDTPLHYAARSGHCEVVTHFITEMNCDPQCRNSIGWTPLHHAASNGHQSVVEYLMVSHNCDASHTNDIGWTALHFACSGGHTSVAAYVAERCSKCLSAEDNYGKTPLQLAQSRGYMRIVQCLQRALTSGRV